MKSRNIASAALAAALAGLFAGSVMADEHNAKAAGAANAGHDAAAAHEGHEMAAVNADLRTRCIGSVAF